MVQRGEGGKDSGFRVLDLGRRVKGLGFAGFGT